MSNIDLAAYKDLYLKTAREHLVNLKKNLVTLNGNPSDKQAIYEMFRLFHSLKSQNFFLGYQSTAQLCKLFEDFFRSINDGKKSFNSGMFGTIHEVIEKLETSLSLIEKNNQETNFESEITNYENKIVKL